jgi:hypothetical protein
MSWYYIEGFAGNVWLINYCVYSLFIYIICVSNIWHDNNLVMIYEYIYFRFINIILMIGLFVIYWHFRCLNYSAKNSALYLNINKFLISHKSIQ